MAGREKKRFNKIAYQRMPHNPIDWLFAYSFCDMLNQSVLRSVPVAFCISKPNEFQMKQQKQQHKVDDTKKKAESAHHHQQSNKIKLI